MKISIKFLFIIITIFLLGKPQLEANAQIVDSAFFGWTVYELQDENDEKKCYIVSNPAKSDSNHNGRQKPYLMITRFEKNRTEEVSLFSGYDYKINSMVFVIIDNNQFRLLAKKDIAWAKSKRDDINIIQTMLNGKTFKARSDSAYGNYAIDEYSLKGVAKAYARMRQICP